ncbi:MAG: hypothetical protein PHW27_02805 [Melioribacteraceae bacterium]|nr:hypothetical protein [Melioribacteraceae bacterium]MDD3557478.1 hypothetical protein [Melioribacteraceae bacterium]
MMKKYFIFIIMFLSFTHIFSQQNNFNSFSRDASDWGSERFNFGKWWGESRPFIEAGYGFGELKHHDFDNSFANIGIIDVKLGYSAIDSYDKTILELDDRFVTFSSIASRLHNDIDLTGVTATNIYRFGFGNRFGYGYDLGSVAIFPYNSGGFVWTKLEIKEQNYPRNSFVPSFDGEVDPYYDMLGRYEDSFRFTQYAEGGINIQIDQLVSVGASYEASVIFPRHLFWKQLISYTIEQFGQGALTFFVEEIMDNSPAAGPIISFLLKNGLSYGMYYLRQQDMNWPFATETPLTYETFKINLSFTF